MFRDLCEANATPPLPRLKNSFLYWRIGNLVRWVPRHGGCVVTTSLFWARYC